jgi:hypothetical protein
MFFFNYYPRVLYVAARKNIHAVVLSCYVVLHAGCWTVSSASARTSQTTYFVPLHARHSIVIEPRLVRYREHSLMCYVRDDQLFLQPQLMPRWENKLSYYVFDAQIFRQPRIMPHWEKNKLCCIMCWMLNFVFNLSLLSHWENKLSYYVFDAQLFGRPQIMPHWEKKTLLYYVLDAQLCLQPRLIASLRKHTIVSCVRCLTASSNSAHVSLRTNAVILCARCSTFASASARTLQAIKAWLIHLHQVYWACV